MGVTTLGDDFESAVTARILTFDLENSPHITYQWSLKNEGYTSPKMMQEAGRVLCWAGKWVGQKEVLFASEFHDGHDGMVRKAWELFDEADIIVTYNGIRHDVPHMQREFRDLALPAAAPHKNVDLLRTMRSKFAYASNTLDYISQRSGIGAKVAHEGFPLWLACMAGDAKAWARMKKYNVGDVRLTEDLYFDILPWISGHPPVKIAADGELLCNRCGSGDLDRIGSTLAVVITYALYRCPKCTGLSRSGHHKRVSNTRAV